MTTPFPPVFHQHKNPPSPEALISPPPHPKINPIFAFTLVELLGVITIIGILAGLTLGAAGAVRRHGATSQAKSEIAALQNACDRFYADQGLYPTNTDPKTADPNRSFDPNNYKSNGATLFANLFGARDFTSKSTTKRYFEPKAGMVLGNCFVDPWGNAYGYNSDGTNAPLIWSTAGTTKGETNKWITSWPKM
jgi:type II secretory pathway pseudopilin PulG